MGGRAAPPRGDGTVGWGPCQAAAPAPIPDHRPSTPPVCGPRGPSRTPAALVARPRENAYRITRGGGAGSREAAARSRERGRSFGWPNGRRNRRRDRGRQRDGHGRTRARSAGAGFLAMWPRTNLAALSRPFGDCLVGRPAFGSPAPSVACGPARVPGSPLSLVHPHRAMFICGYGLRAVVDMRSTRATGGARGEHDAIRV